MPIQARRKRIAQKGDLKSKLTVRFEHYKGFHVLLCVTGLSSDALILQDKILFPYIPRVNCKMVFCSMPA